MMDQQELDARFRVLLKGGEPDINDEEAARQIFETVSAGQCVDSATNGLRTSLDEGAAARRPRLHTPRGRRRVLLTAFAAVIVLSAISVGVLEAVAHLGGPRQILVFGDTNTTAPDWLGTTSSSTTPTTGSSPPVFGNTVNFLGEEITVWATGLWGGATEGVDEDKELQSIEVRIVNNHLAGNIEYSFVHFEARDNKGLSYDASLKVQGQGLLRSGMLAAGEAVVGYVGFEIPKGNTLASVTYTPITYGWEPESVTWER